MGTAEKIENCRKDRIEITLRSRGLRVDREYPCRVVFPGRQIGFQRLDMHVEGRIAVELKASERLADSAKQQWRCYVNVLGLPPGILLHFGPKPGFYRVLGRGGLEAQCSSSAVFGSFRQFRPWPRRADIRDAAAGPRADPPPASSSRTSCRTQSGRNPSRPSSCGRSSILEPSRPPPLRPATSRTSRRPGR